ncbi:hypothetical protein A2U01_0087376, partial [Trifolium medium]|nr:hypothetical protein [Trifolium medium]
MNFRWKSAYPVMEFFGKFIYHLKAASLKILDRSLHFKCFAAPTMVVCVPTAI